MATTTRRMSRGALAGDVHPRRYPRDILVFLVTSAIYLLAPRMWETWQADVADFALASSGARIVRSEPPPPPISSCDVMRMLSTLEIGEEFNKCRSSPRLGPSAVLDPNVLPGECWAFDGQKATLVIRLANRIRIVRVAIEHIPVSISPTGDISSAPKHFEVIGVDGKGSEEDISLGHSFGSFTYERDGPPSQFFDLAPSERPFDLVAIRFQSNWGNQKYTCVYRVRVHGHIAILGRR